MRRVSQRDEPSPKIPKIAVAALTEADLFDYHTTIKCLACNIDNIEKSFGGLSEIADSVMKANTFSRKEEVKAWEQIYTSCEHILTLQQGLPRQIESQDLGHCSLCDLNQNLWLCLECGNLGCGRAQFGGLKGNSHALEHKNILGHAVAVKLGSITPEGTADVYCYACDEERIDDNLGTHLKNWGITMAERQKTEKSLTEMQIDENLRWEFSMADEDGHELEKLFGCGLTGLKNLGNSCYLASTLQCLFSLPQFQERYYINGDLPIVDDPAQDLETQLRKLADGLLSGRYSCPDPSQSSAGIAYQKGLAPAMLKHLIGKGHPEFSTMQQQDAFEFLLHVFELISRSQHKAPLQDPTRAFRFVVEQRLQCLNCKKVRYRSDKQDNISIPVPVRKISRPNNCTGEVKKTPDEYESVTLKQCMDCFTSQEIVELTCSGCGSKDGFFKRSLFKTFPEILVVNARRFMIVNWVPTKVDVPIIVEDEPFNMDEYISPGHQPHEELLPEDEDNGKPAFIPNIDALLQLENMGFPRNRCEKALHATGNSDTSLAMEWLFSHMEDPDIDSPLQVTKAPNSILEHDREKVEMLAAMGFSESLSCKALSETGGDVERAVEWLFSHPDDDGGACDKNRVEESDKAKKDELPGSCDSSVKFQLHSIICHKGSSIHAG